MLGTQWAFRRKVHVPFIQQSQLVTCQTSLRCPDNWRPPINAANVIFLWTAFQGVSLTHLYLLMSNIIKAFLDGWWFMAYIQDAAIAQALHKNLQLPHIIKSSTLRKERRKDKKERREEVSGLSISPRIPCHWSLYFCYVQVLIGAL